MMNIFKTYGNPLSSEHPSELHNFVTKECMPGGVRYDLLNIFEIGEQKYSNFRYQRILQKNDSLHKTIHRQNIRNMLSLHKPTPENKGKSAIKAAVQERNISERIVEVARERGKDN